MSTQTQREITIYATRGGKMEKIMTDVTTWGELKPLVKKAGYDLSSLLAAESFTKHDLVNDLALLPVENFRLFLRPKQTKSGAEMSYKELRGAIKDILDGNEEAKEHFNQGKNYTTKGTEELRSLYNSYGGKKTSAPQPVKKVIKAKKAGKNRVCFRVGLNALIFSTDHAKLQRFLRIPECNAFHRLSVWAFGLESPKQCLEGFRP